MYSIIPFLNTYYVVVHNPTYPICEENFQKWSKPHMHHVLNYVITGKFSSIQDFFYWSKHVIIEWRWVWTIPEVWEKFKFQLTDCFIGRCHRMWTCVFVEQKNLLRQLELCTYCESWASAFWPQKTDHSLLFCSSAFESTASIFKEDLWTSINWHWLVTTVSITWSLRQLLGFTVH